MKLLVLLEYGIPHYRKFIFDYLNGLADDFLVIHTGENYKNKHYEFKTLKCPVTNIWRFGFHRNIRRFLKEYDVVIASFNFWRPMCWLPVFVSGKKYILWGQAYGRWDNAISRGIKKSAAKRAGAILLYTKKGKEYYTKKLNIEQNKIFITNNTLDIPNHRLTKGERSYFLYVGRIQKRKGLADMIEVLAEIKNQHGLEGEVLRIVGDGEPANGLKKLVKNKTLGEHVNFVGAVYDNNELIKHFSGALAYVSPGHVGLGVVHSFSYGIPVLTDKTALHAPEFDYCNHENSFLYTDRNEFKQIVKQLLKNGQESYLKGSNAYRRYIENLSAEYTCEMFRKAIMH